MKKLCLIPVLMLCCIMSFSQDKYGISVGAGYTLMPVKESFGGLSESRNFNGFHVGADYTFSSLLGPVSLTPGIWYFFGTDKEGGVSETFQDIQIPVDFSWGVEAGPLYVFIYAGPSFSLNVAWVESVAGISTSFYSTTSGKDFNRFDIKLGGGAGLVFNDFLRLKIGYRAGVLNGCGGDMAKYCTIRRGQFTVGLAYCF